MPEDQKTTATEILADAAAVAAKLSVDASITAQNVIATAADVAAKERNRQDSERESMKGVFVDALNQVFGEKQEQQQFINLARVPLICVQISEIHKSLSEIALAMESLKIAKNIIFGLFGLVGTGVVLALLNLLLKS